MLADIQLVILEGRGCNRFLRSWAARFPNRRILNVSDFPDHVAAHRNRVFKWFRDECTAKWLIMMDDDVVPIAATDAFVQAEGDIIGAKAIAKTGSEMHPHAFSMTAVKVHRRVIEAVTPPWFAFMFTPDGVMQELCECLYFHKKATEAGFRTTQAGAVGHRFMVTVVPPGEGETRPQLLFDDEVNEGLRSARSKPAGGT